METRPEKKKARARAALVGAAFLMATSAIGPGFLTQTAAFTGSLGASFGFVILVSLLMSAAAQLNIWRVLCRTGLRGQDAANRLVKGLGYALAALIALGGLAFNIGNVGGGALGLNALAGVPDSIGCVMTGLAAAVVFLFKQARSIVDRVVKYLGALMLLVILAVVIATKAPLGEAARNTVLPSADAGSLFPAVLTLLGGTVGGYITFAGAHRLIDAGVTGEAGMKRAQRSALLGVGLAAAFRVLLFLAVLGVVTRFPGIDLTDPSKNAAIVGADYGGVSNPAAYAFRIGAGELAYRFAGVVLLAASVTSVIGAAYTSVSFLKTFHPAIERHENAVIIAFIAVSTAVMTALGGAARLLVVVSALNGLILPLSLGVCLAASQSKRIMGEDYRHPVWLFIAGVIVVIAAAYVGVKGISGLFG